jgi:AraC-like DNA-binding protein
VRQPSSHLDVLLQTYGYERHQVLWGANLLGDLLTDTYPSLDDIGSLRPGEIYHAMHDWRIGDLSFVAGSHSPFYAKSKRTYGHTLTLHYRGLARYHHDHQTFVLQPNINALILADVPASAEIDDVSSLVVRFEPQRVMATARIMFGLDDGFIDLNTRLITISNPLLRKHIASLPALLAGLREWPADAEDTVNRLIARLVYVPKGRELHDTRLNRRRQVVDTACAFLMEHLQSDITLSDIESVSGSSARNLQLAFLDRFGMTPKEWLTNQRLLAASRALARTGAPDSISEIAVACGFRHFGRFSTQFKRRFGLTPSALREIKRIKFS